VTCAADGRQTLAGSVTVLKAGSGCGVTGSPVVTARITGIAGGSDSDMPHQVGTVLHCVRVETDVASGAIPDRRGQCEGISERWIMSPGSPALIPSHLTWLNGLRRHLCFDAA
jgi:hypothetical protein